MKNHLAQTQVNAVLIRSGCDRESILTEIREHRDDHQSFQRLAGRRVTNDEQKGAQESGGTSKVRSRRVMHFVALYQPTSGRRP